LPGVKMINKKFLGILFAGGKGERLGLITRYISKAFVPVYDRPVFMYPLAQLEASRYIGEIVILTNTENDAKLKQTGYRTLIQDDDRVHDMFSGLRQIREDLKINQDCVLMPCDNISDVSVDAVIETFTAAQCQVCFSLIRVPDRRKLSQMGVYDPANGQVVYKPANPPSEWGVIAPYVVSGDFTWGPADTDAEVFNQARLSTQQHTGYWFDIGDSISYAECLKKHFLV
jgi:NDP-sugar pyrophosphorylase family protein